MKTWVITPGFCKAELLEDFLKYLYKDGPIFAEHIVTNNHYPVDCDRNGQRIKELAGQYACTFVDSGYDRGLHHSVNYATRLMGVGPDDIVIGVDADDRPDPGFVADITETMRADPSLAVLGLNFSVIDWRRSQGVPFVEKDVGGRTVLYHPSIEMWNTAGFRWSFIERTGGFNQPNAYYGGLESYLHSKWAPLGLRLGYLVNTYSDRTKVNRDDPRLFDKSYGDWKIAHATQGYNGSFADYIYEWGSK